MSYKQFVGCLECLKTCYDTDILIINEMLVILLLQIYSLLKSATNFIKTLILVSLFFS